VFFIKQIVFTLNSALSLFSKVYSLPQDEKIKQKCKNNRINERTSNEGIIFSKLFICYCPSKEVFTRGKKGDKEDFDFISLHKET